MSNAPIGFEFRTLYDFGKLTAEELPALLDEICGCLRLRVDWRRLDGGYDVEFIVTQEER
jgi:hypothetical protein